ncbi:MAG TPA: AgmX/PglI C-terminal domain-containing protein [Nannocystaceae bacterium]|nr:AgmX/PglI C-terminal domain-containing protein [Nannocystaceae bacterium]
MHMRNTIYALAFIALSTILPGCSCVARDSETYRKDTRSLVETRNQAIKECYDVALATDANVSGDVVVTFNVEKKTGKIIDPKVDSGRTTAPESLGQCIVEAIDGLELDPVDQREGQATMAWTFRANPPKPAS